ncbi:MAG: hypothetical protein RLZZ385_2524 [Pseudomonadota bacterium]|jgi:cell division septation protein DedD
MVQDFAKIRPEPLLDKKPAVAPPAWTLLFTGLVTGMAIGVFGCVLFYLSGNVPPLQGVPPVSASVPGAISPPAAVEATAQTQTAAVDEPLQLEFYNALPDYEVIVDATPVEVAPDELTTGSLEAAVMLQIGAYERMSNAESQRARLQALGLQAIIKEEPRPGKVLLLVQAGPYQDRQVLSQAETTLRANNISSRRISLTASPP